ncbi:MerR family transcriptional regulator [Fusobacterium sp. MFO224]|uniref:MerR family transcriptional regulator n=1 Tax=Fusobacterium sp. MFO224 TaxID=3378070 RepID=UPI0038536343
MNSQKKKFYKIGEISKLYGVSSDILRYYNKIGLVKPDFVGENGYRYYSKKQIWKLNSIRNLRNLGVGLEEIKKFLYERNTKNAEEMLEFQLNVISEKINKLEELREEINNKIENINFFKGFNDFNKPILKYIPERKILKSKGILKKDWEIDFEIKILNKKTAYKDDILLTNNEVGAFISKENFYKKEYQTFSGTFIINEEKGEKLAEGYYLSFVFKGSYENSPKYYKILKNYIVEHNYEVIGEILEIYHIEVHITENEDEYITEIQIPVDKVNCK